MVVDDWYCIKYGESTLKYGAWEHKINGKYTLHYTNISTSKQNQALVQTTYLWEAAFDAKMNHSNIFFSVRSGELKTEVRSDQGQGGAQGTVINYPL